MALRLPTVTEVVDRIDEADPVLAWQVSGMDAAGIRAALGVSKRAPLSCCSKQALP
jgi:hypothetical protein